MQNLEKKILHSWLESGKSYKIPAKRSIPASQLPLDFLEEDSNTLCIKFRIGDKVFLKTKRASIFVIVQIQGNDYYTCRALQTIIRPRQTRYEETTDIFILHADLIKICDKIRNYLVKSH